VLPAARPAATADGRGESDSPATPPDGPATATGAAVAAAAPGSATAQDNAAPAVPDAGRDTAPPLFRSQRQPPAVPPVIPIVRAPDDPGVDSADLGDEFGATADAPAAQRGGWRGFLSRFGA